MRRAGSTLDNATGFLRATLNWFAENRRVTISLLVLLGFYSVALLAPMIAPHPPNEQILVNRFAAPNLDHPFGTDAFGRDILSRAIWGARITLSISLVATLITVLIGGLVGLVSGYAGGWVDNVAMRITDLFLTFPVFILLITVVAVFGNSITLLVLFLGLSAWPQTARIVRAEVLSLMKRDFLEAAKVMGARSPRIILVHLFPNVIPVLMVSATFRIGVVVLIAAGLSYFGLGVTPPTAEWGNMVADGKLYLENAWWVSLFPGLLIVIIVFTYNILGDALRDALDPRRRRSGV